MNNIILITLICASLFISCSNNSTGTGGNSTPTVHPSIQFVQGAYFVYQNDTIYPNGQNQLTPYITYDRIDTMITISNKLGYQIFDSTRDNNNNLVSFDTIYLSYDSAGGKLYQYGVQKFINPSLPYSWDLIGDFSVPIGQLWEIGSINIPVIIEGQNVIFTGTLTANIAVDTTIVSRGTPSVTIKCYRIELNASVSGTYNDLPITANLILDDFIGYNSTSYGNQSGIARIRIRPTPIYSEGVPSGIILGGHDRFIESFVQ